jgi:glycerol uptake facilitator-like aquaporin
MYAYLVEFFGTLFFIYVILATSSPLAIGAALALVIVISQSISGGMMNPAVTIVMAAAGKIPTTEIIPFCVAQILGGLVALQVYKRYTL